MKAFTWIFTVFLVVILALSEVKSEEENPCSLPSASGGPKVYCRALFTKWFHNPETKQCETFIYGGCDGNDNRFNTKEECEARCINKT